MTVLRALTTATSVAVGASPAPSYYRMYQRRSTGDMSILPVVALFGNCYLWMIYGYLVGNFVPLFAVCAFGGTTSIIFMIVFYLLTPDRAFVYKLWAVAALCSVVLAVYAAIGVAGVTNQPRHQVEQILGYFAVALNLCLYASPLATMRHVVAVKDASSMPITMSIVGVVNGCLWVSVAVGDDDMFVLVPNAVGALLSAVQIALYGVYRPGKYAQRASGVVADGSDALATKIAVEEDGARSPHYVQAALTP
jgi:solute carrier family 50 protein (sugar transporter)